MLAVSPGLCAGGAHVVDDSAVEDPGTCHVENWLSLSDGSNGLITVAPACTPKGLPSLELGGFVAHGWTRADSATLGGLGAKLNLRGAGKGLGIALSGSLGYSVDRKRLETAGLTVPITIPAGPTLRFNIDTGWQWTRQDDRSDLFVGAQTEYQISPDLGLMAETFTRTIHKAGGQIGLRWTPHQGKIDFDLIMGRYVDGVTPNAVTLGLTIRI